jgi:hypothetical protein
VRYVDAYIIISNTNYSRHGRQFKRRLMFSHLMNSLRFLGCFDFSTNSIPEQHSEKLSSYKQNTGSKLYVTSRQNFSHSILIIDVRLRRTKNEHHIGCTKCLELKANILGELSSMCCMKILSKKHVREKQR